MSRFQSLKELCFILSKIFKNCNTAIHAEQKHLKLEKISLVTTTLTMSYFCLKYHQMNGLDFYLLVDHIVITHIQNDGENQTTKSLCQPIESCDCQHLVAQIVIWSFLLSIVLSNVRTKIIYHIDEVRIGKTQGVNLVDWTEPWRGPDRRFIPRVSLSSPHQRDKLFISPISCLYPCYQMFFVLWSIWPIYRIGKCRLTSPSDVITTCVVCLQELATGKNDNRNNFLSLWSQKTVHFNTWCCIYRYCRRRDKRYAPFSPLVSLIMW